MGARDEVAVEVHDGLACRLAAIHPHVVAVRLVALLDPGFRQVQNSRQRPLLLRRQAEPVWARAVGDDEQVAGRDGKAVLDHKEMLGAQQHPLFRKLIKYGGRGVVGHG